MTDHDNDIDALLEYLTVAVNQHWIKIPRGVAADYHVALTALVAERNALKAQCSKRFDFKTIKDLIAERNGLQEENNALRSRCKAHQDEEADRVFEILELRKRVAELKAQPPAASNLRERLVESALRGVSVAGLHRSEVELLGKASVWMVDAALAAMRKGEANGE